MRKEDPVIRFWRKVNKDGPLPDQSNPHYEGLGQCWEWLGSTRPKGYGRHRVDQKFYRAHRVSWAISNRRNVPKGKFVLHRCDNPKCVNPDHLWLGTIRDNTQDMIAKGRANYAYGDRSGSRKHPECLARGKRHGWHTHPECFPRGDQHTATKVSDAQVKEIQKLYASGDYWQKDIAAAYGVSVPLISMLVRGLTRKHLSTI